MASKVQLSGGAFQDIQGSPLALGYILMQLSQDALVTGTPSQQIAAGSVVKITLDSSGNVVASPAQYVWPNDVLTPANTFYTVSAYTAQGQLVWGPNSQQVFSTPSPYGIGAWKPNSVNTSPQNAVTYDIGVFYPGQVASSQLMLLVPVERTVTFATNMVPSTSACGTNPTASLVVTLKKNGTSFATLTVNTSGVGTFAGSATTFSAGDVLTVYGPSSADATWADIGITLSGTTVSSNS